ncbi:MAG TPA: hypothetical protein VIX80_07920 [Candidatus Kapabacteria bacterium]
MSRSIIYILVSFLFVSILLTTDSYGQSSAKRKQVLDKIASSQGPPYFAVIASQLKTGTNKEVGFAKLDTLLSLEKGDMFWMYGCAGLYFSCRTELPDQYKTKIRECWKKCTPYRGDTENHFLMYYGSLYLMSQEWQGLAGSEWFTGKSSVEIHNESREYLRHWIDEISTVGMMEFDSPRYMYYFITPLLLLAEHTTDAEDKRLFTMALELMLADYAHDYYFGNYAGAHSRVGFDSPFDTRNTETSSYGDLYFDENITHFLPDIAFAAMASFSCPEIIKNIATKKSYPFESIEMKRGRTTLRYTYEKNATVTKKLYATKEYALGSMQGGLVSPIQQQSWSLVINTSKPNNVITGLHPYIAKEELGMFFPEEPSWQLERIEGAKKGYSSEDKWVGGTLFDNISHDKNTLSANYQKIIKKIRSQKIAFRLPKWAVVTIEGDAMISAQCEAVKVKVNLPTGYRKIDEEDSYRFEADVTGGAASYTVTCPEVVGARASFLGGGDFLYHSDYIHSERGSGIVILEFGNKKRVLDFKKILVSEE